MKIYIDAACDIHYSSFYINGINEFYGKKRVTFTNKFFLDFKHNNHFLAYVIKNENVEKRIIIDFADTSEVHDKALQWSDVYAKINIDETKKNNSKKIISIGPSFGIHIYSLFQTVRFSIRNYLKSYSRINNKRKFFSDYKAQYYRPKLKDYYPSQLKKDYVYFVASLWKKEKQTNNFRANFIKSCLSKNIEFEGGFAPRTKNDISGYENLTMSKRDKMEDYVLKTKKSFFVFNTPAVLDCHGWKLAEFMCFGKAILSTEISRELPEQLKDEKHLIFTDGSLLDMDKKLTKLLNDKNLVKKLSKNSRTYFEEVLSPIKVIKKLNTL